MPSKKEETKSKRRNPVTDVNRISAPPVDDAATSADQSASREQMGPDIETRKRPIARRASSPYRAIFVSKDKGFEMGEDFQFKQRVFKFSEKPDAEVIAALKENGFTYRPVEKSWTRQADYTSRGISDQLARRFADAELSFGR
jgi:hypothetical protein